MRLPIVPILISAIIASNIGGASLPWADTPAVILTLYTDFNLMDFLTKLSIPAVIYCGLLVLYTIVWFRKYENKLAANGADEFVQYLNDEEYEKEEILKNIEYPQLGIHPPIHDGIIHLRWNIPEDRLQVNETRHEESKDNSKRSLKMGEIFLPIIIFTLLITGICIAPFFDISIAYVCLFFGGLALIVNKVNPADLLNSLIILDSIMFIAAMFLISGAIESSGILIAILDYMQTFMGDNKLLILLFIMISAFIIATFLSAGPAAATILPLCLQLSPIIGGKLIFAALALGILAGSSMLPWSATGGPVMLGEVNRFLMQFKGPESDVKKIEEIFSLKLYLQFSIPFSLIMLFMSSIFLTLYLAVY
jgi:Na+/H+ antiporter NhaD/arsenite permease-like protein